MILKVTAIIGIEVPDDANPEHVAAAFDLGLEHQLGGFPNGDVFDARIDTIETPDEAELAERGWTE